MKILARNVRVPHGELDVIAMDGDTLVIVEVRTQHDCDVKTPEQSIRHAKKRNVLRSAREYVRQRKLNHLPVRIDVVAIVWPRGGKPEIRHHRAAIRG